VQGVANASGAGASHGLILPCDLLLLNLKNGLPNALLIKPKLKLRPTNVQQN